MVSFGDGSGHHGGFFPTFGVKDNASGSNQRGGLYLAAAATAAPPPPPAHRAPSPAAGAPADAQGVYFDEDNASSSRTGNYGDDDGEQDLAAYLADAEPDMHGDTLWRECVKSRNFSAHSILYS